MERRHVIQITDLHLSAERAYSYPGWRACLAHINRERPDFVAVTGDLVLDDPDHDPDHAFVRAELARIEVPWADLGDSGPEPYMDQWITQERRGRYLSHHAADRWVHELGRWRLIGVNAQLLGSGLAAEAEQHAWLEQRLAEGRGRPLALFLHKPLFIHGHDEEDRPGWCVTRKGREAFLGLIRQANVRLVASGHAHHYRTLAVDGMSMVWAPSTAQVMRRASTPFRAVSEPGVVHYWFEDDKVEFCLVKPEGLAANDISDLVERHGAMRYAPGRPAIEVSASE